MFCKYCGKELSDDSTFCQYCGKAQPAAQGNTQNGAQRTVQNPAPATAQPVRRAGPRKSFFKRLKAGTRLFSFTAWIALVIVILVLVCAAVLLLDAILGFNLISLMLGALVAGFAGFLYLMGIHQFCHAAEVEDGLYLKLPGGKSDSAWLAQIRDHFSFEGAQLMETQPENAVAYLMRGTRMLLTARNGVLRIEVEHQKRYNASKDPGKWKLYESFMADDLKCALRYFLSGQPLPESFVNDQKAAHVDKVGTAKVWILVAVLVLLVLSMLFGR